MCPVNKPASIIVLLNVLYREIYIILLRESVLAWGCLQAFGTMQGFKGGTAHRRQQHRS